MLTGFKWRSAEDESDRKLLSDVQQYGWHIVGVFDDGIAEEVRPDFAFSVGLYLNHEHPEIVLMGFPRGKAARIINAVGARIRSGEQIRPGVRYSGFAQDRDVMFRPVRPENYGEYLGSALWFYRSLLPDSFPALQLVWPDAAGVFPWEENFDQSYARLQHHLWEVQPRAPEEP